MRYLGHLAGKSELSSQHHQIMLRQCFNLEEDHAIANYGKMYNFEPDNTKIHYLAEEQGYGKSDGMLSEANLRIKQSIRGKNNGI